jgi:hypothetical protein
VRVCVGCDIEPLCPNEITIHTRPTERFAMTI